jgi:hypothetical protein
MSPKHIDISQNWTIGLKNIEIYVATEDTERCDAIYFLRISLLFCFVHTVLFDLHYSAFRGTELKITFLKIFPLPYSCVNECVLCPRTAYTCTYTYKLICKISLHRPRAMDKTFACESCVKIIGRIFPASWSAWNYKNEDFVNLFL